MSTTKKVIAKPRVLATYNRSLDCLALAASLASQGRMKLAAQAFDSAIKDPSLKAGIAALDATNAYGMQALKASVGKGRTLRAEADEDLSDEEIDTLLNGDDVEADVDEDFDDMDDEDDDDDGGILEEAGIDDDDDDMDDEDDEQEDSSEVFAAVLKRLKANGQRGRRPARR